MAEQLYAHLDRIKEMNPRYVLVRGFDGNTTKWYNLKDLKVKTVDAKYVASLVNVNEKAITTYQLETVEEDWLKQLLELSSPLGQVKCLYYNEGMNTYAGGFEDAKLFIFVDGIYLLELSSSGSFD